MIEISQTEALQLVQQGAIYIPIYLLTDSQQKIYPCSQLTISMREHGEDFIQVQAVTTSEPPAAQGAPEFTLTCGLRFIDKGKQCQQMINYMLILRETSYSAINSSWSMSLHSQESIVRDYGIQQNQTYTSNDDLQSVITQIIRKALPAAQITADAGESVKFLADGERYVWEQNAPAWGAIQEICDLSSNYTCYNDGQEFQIARVPQTPAASPDYIIPPAYLTSFELKESRENFYNCVQTSYTSEPVVTATAVKNDGNPPRLYAEQINRQGTYLQALQRAKSVLERKYQEATNLTVIIARLPLGLHPYQTVSITYGKRNYVGIISEIEYNLQTAETTITLRAIKKG